MRRTNLELQIDALVLHGFASRDRYSIAEATERELDRLFAEQGTPPSLVRDRDVARLDGGVFEVRTGSRAEAIGAEVARALYGGLG